LHTVTPAPQSIGRSQPLSMHEPTLLHRNKHRAPAPHSMLQLVALLQLTVQTAPSPQSIRHSPAELQVVSHAAPASQITLP